MSLARTRLTNEARRMSNGLADAICLRRLILRASARLGLRRARRATGRRRPHGRRRLRLAAGRGRRRLRRAGRLAALGQHRDEGVVGGLHEQRVGADDGLARDHAHGATLVHSGLVLARAQLHLQSARARVHPPLEDPRSERNRARVAQQFAVLEPLNPRQRKSGDVNVEFDSVAVAVACAAKTAVRGLRVALLAALLRHTNERRVQQLHLRKLDCV